MDEHINTLKKLEDKAYKIYNEIRDKVRILEEVPKAKALVGQCFKYENSYNATDSWWLYLMVTRCNQSAIFMDSFQKYSNGKIEFVFDKSHYIHSLGSSYIPISIEEYDKAKKALLKKLIKRLGV